MQHDGRLRLVRGGVTAALATFAALFAHMLAGGAAPGAAGLVVPFALALPFAVALTGRRFSVVRLSLAVVLSQTAFHTLFVLGVETSGGTVPAGHAGHLSGPITLGQVTASAETLAMPLLHVAAAAITVAYLVSLDRWIAAAPAAVRRVLDRLTAVPTLLPLRPAVPAATHVWLPAAAAVRGRPLSRGPPDALTNQ